MPFWNKMNALLRQRCPRCLRGRVYRRCITMYERCPDCDLLYERERGYFMGSMYISYGMAIGLMGLFMFLVSLAFPDWDSGTMALTAIALFLPLAPFVSRYARVIWMYFDRWAWPDESP